jgi:hypothetical protein
VTSEVTACRQCIVISIMHVILARGSARMHAPTVSDINVLFFFFSFTSSMLLPCCVVQFHLSTAALLFAACTAGWARRADVTDRWQRLVLLHSNACNMPHCAGNKLTREDWLGGTRLRSERERES